MTSSSDLINHSSFVEVELSTGHSSTDIKSISHSYHRNMNLIFISRSGFTHTLIKEEEAPSSPAALSVANMIAKVRRGHRPSVEIEANESSPTTEDSAWLRLINY